MKIALAQMEIIQGDIEANLAKMRHFITSARKRKADVIVFPEYSLTGSVRDRPDLIDHDGRCRKIFSELAKKHRIDIVSGSFVEMDKGRPYNTSCYFDRSGKLLASYKKINLWHSERERMGRGKESAVFDTRFGKAGLAICWDLSYPELFRHIAKKGARVIYVPSFWSDGGNSTYRIESANIDALCHARAFENECAIVFANAAGKYAENDRLVGHSQITLPIKGAIRKIASNKESLIVADIHAGTFERAAGIYKIREDMKNGYIK